MTNRQAGQPLVNRVQRMIIRQAGTDDGTAIGAILGPVFRAGETYPLPRGMSDAEAASYWMSADHLVFVFEEAGSILGTYYLRANQRGGGGHVANAGYVTASHASGRGIARQMGEHSFRTAKARGFRAMQFNLVISSNTRAVALWQRLGMEIVGRLPGAFNHPTLGYVDALVMFRSL